MSLNDQTKSDRAYGISGSVPLPRSNRNVIASYLMSITDQAAGCELIWLAIEKTSTVCRTTVRTLLRTSRVPS